MVVEGRGAGFAGSGPQLGALRSLFAEDLGEGGMDPAEEAVVGGIDHGGVPGEVGGRIGLDIIDGTDHHLGRRCDRRGPRRTPCSAASPAARVSSAMRTSKSSPTASWSLDAANLK